MKYRTLLCLLFLIGIISCNRTKNEIEILLSSDKVGVSKNTLNETAEILKKRLDLAGLKSSTLVLPDSAQIKIKTSTASTEMFKSLLQPKGVFKILECAPAEIVQKAISQLDNRMKIEFKNSPDDILLKTLKHRFSNTNIPFSFLLSRFPGVADWKTSPFFGIINESDSTLLPHIQKSLSEVFPTWIRIQIVYKPILKSFFLYSLNTNSNILILNDYLKLAVLDYDNEKKPYLGLSFNDAGSAILKSLTTRMIGKPILLMIDESIVSAPIVAEPVENGLLKLSDNFSVADAMTMKIILNSGELPVKMQISSIKNIN